MRVAKNLTWKFVYYETCIDIRFQKFDPLKIRVRDSSKVLEFLFEELDRIDKDDDHIF